MSSKIEIRIVTLPEWKGIIHTSFDLEWKATQHKIKILRWLVSILFYVATNGLIVLPNFESIDEYFSYRKELVPTPTHPSHHLCNRQFEYIEKRLSNRLACGASDEDVVETLVIQTKE